MATVALFALSIVGAGIGMLPMLTSVLGADEQRLTADGEARQITTGPGERLMLWVGDRAPAAPTCEASDVASQARLVVEPVARYHHEGRSGYYRSVARFEARGPATSVVCTGDAQAVYVTEAYDEQWALRHLLPIFGPFVVFTAAAAVCLVVWTRSGRAR